MATILNNILQLKMDIRQIIFFLACIILTEVVSADVSASLWQLQEGTPLMFAARDGNVAKVKELLDRGQNVNEQNKKDSATPLIFAASTGRIDTPRLLLNRGADPNLCAWANTCPIWWAVRSGSYETVKLLIEAGANVNKNPEVDSLEHPILQEAVFSGQESIVKLLLDSGIEIDYTNFLTENTALAAAVRVGKANIARMLIERGADLGAVTEVPYYEGRTALEIAKKEGHKAAVEVIESALKSGKYRPKYSIESIIEKLYRDSMFDLAAQDNGLMQFLRKQTKETIRKVRNTIFARKNYHFDDPELIEYFRKRFPSYKPIAHSYEMSSIDKRNVEYLIEIERYRAARDSAG